MHPWHMSNRPPGRAFVTTTEARDEIVALLSTPRPALHPASRAHHVDYLNSTNDCGSCGWSCPTRAGAVSECIVGQCYLTCPGLEGQRIDIDFDNDPDNCGGCGTICQQPIEGPRQCVDGTCAGACPAGDSTCNGACVDQMTDANNCGGCGIQCSDYGVYGFAPTCSSGICVQPCAANEIVCNGSCIDPSNNIYHCGYCDNECTGASGGHRVCEAGSCKAPVCYDADETVCSGDCTDLDWDEANCGSCGYSCATTAAAARAAGAVLRDDPNDIGRCNQGECDFVIISYDNTSCSNVCGQYGISCGDPATSLPYWCWAYGGNMYEEGNVLDDLQNGVGCTDYRYGTFGQRRAVTHLASCSEVPVSEVTALDTYYWETYTYTFEHQWCYCRP